MSREIVVKFKNVNDAERIDLTRIGIVSGGDADGTSVIVEPDIAGWDGVRDETRNEILRSGLAAAGVWVEVTTREV